jgi:hypothetical protein
MPGGGAAFTLLEVMLATFISAIVFAGVLSAYIFLGRALTRQANEQEMESRSRIAITYFTLDVSSASCVDPTAMTATTLALYSPDASDEVIYTYNAAAGTLTRTTTGSAPGGATPLLLLRGIAPSSFSFNYYTFVPWPSATPPSLPPPPAAVKAVNMAFTTTSGAVVSGASSQLALVSPRVALKNKSFLGTTPNGLP